MAAFVSTLFLGATVGSIYALSALGLILTYRASGVFNFAQGAMGMLAAFAYYQLVQGGRVRLVLFGSVYDQTWRVPGPLAFVLVVAVLAPALGLWLDRVLFRRLRSSGGVVQMVVTIGLLIALQGVAGVMWGSATSLVPRSIFGERIVSAGAFRISLSDLGTLALAVTLAVGLLLFLRATPLGVRMRAVVDRPELAELMGVDSGRLSAVSWGLAGGFAALAGILIAPSYGSLDIPTLSFVVVAGIAAAAVGRLESFPLAMAGGLGIGMAQLVVQRYVPGELGRQLRPAIPFVVLFAVLFLPHYRRRAAERIAAPPIARPGRPLSLRTRMAVAMVGGGVAILLPFVTSPFWQAQLARVPSVALVFLSLVVLAGYAGQISLCQGALAGFGALVAAHLVRDVGVPFLAAAVVGGLAAVPLGAVLASRAASLPPLFLGLATLAFGAVADEVAFKSLAFAGGLSGIAFQRPGFLHSQRAYYLFTLGAFGAVALAVRNLRRGQTGLALAAMRDSEVALSAVGRSVVRLKFVSFCLSAFLAGLGGVLVSGADEVAQPVNFATVNSLLFLALAVVGGIASWPGALVGAGLAVLGPPLLQESPLGDNPLARFLFDGGLGALLPVLFGLAAIALAHNPQGIVAQVREGIERLAERAPVPPPGAAALSWVAASDDGGPVSFPHARLYHRPDCLLAAGKPGRRVTAAAARGLSPCPVCDPPPPAGERRVRKRQP